MEHGYFPFSPIVARPALRWPQGARLAVCVVLHFESWEIEPPAGAVRPPGVHGAWHPLPPDYRTWSYREYGHRVGVFRVLDALDAHGIPVTVAAGALACEQYPAVLRAFLDRGYEIAAHGLAATRMISAAMTEQEERDHIEGSLRAVEQASGRQVAGWIGQDAGESARTPALLAERGLRYLADWPNDEQPYELATTPPIVSLPLNHELSDLSLLWLRELAAGDYVRCVVAAAERMLRDGAHGGRMLMLSVNPWLIGRPHLIGGLRAVLRELDRLADLWWATASEVTDAYGRDEPTGRLRR